MLNTGKFRERTADELDIVADGTGGRPATGILTAAA
jgi:hypothetical protein